ncbi:hypothetical protein [Virgibacillus sp. DJP39]|uniref:hypothetical protein n=1 Tax=Virgibacillus sp. DJP39 TaxID=3409790 RepID=UPI003BB677DE
MFKKILLVLITALILGACNQKDAEPTTAITLEEVITSISDQGLTLEEVDLPENNAFIQDLNGVSPTFYSLKGTPLSIYIFQTVNDRKEGIEEFEKSTETGELERFNTFTIKNVLIFYVEGEKVTNKKLTSAVSELN